MSIRQLVRVARRRPTHTTAWVTCLLVPGVQPMPVFLPTPPAMVLTRENFAVVVALSTWVLFRRDGMPTAPR